TDRRQDLFYSGVQATRARLKRRPTNNRNRTNRTDRTNWNTGISPLSVKPGNLDLFRVGCLPSFFVARIDVTCHSNPRIVGQTSIQSPRSVVSSVSHCDLPRVK